MVDNQSNGEVRPEEIIGEEIYRLEELQDAWNAFIEEMRRQGRDRDVNALNQPWELAGDDTILLKVPNSFQLVAIDNIRQELVLFLRKKLNNRNILLKSEAIKIESHKRIYTNSEKFEYLAEKYPKLRNLKQRFDLDVDF
jgi:DNA polymerase III subunit gamma/tau